MLDILTHKNIGDAIRHIKFFSDGGPASNTVVPLGSPEIADGGQTIGMVLANSYEVARDAAHRTIVDCETASPSATFGSPGAVDQDLAGQTKKHEDPKVGDFASAFAAAPVTVDIAYSTPSHEIGNGMYTVAGQAAAERLGLSGGLCTRRGCLHNGTFRRAACPMMPDVQVITINAGRSRHLARLLDGLSASTHPAECIVVEMGTVAAEPLFATRGVRLVSFDRHGLPLAAARNAGRRAAVAEVLIFLDVDCIPSADLVAALLAHAAANDALICCEVTYLPAGAVEDSWTEVKLRQIGQRHPARSFPGAGLAEAPHPGLFWSLAFAVRAATFDRIGGFDEGFDGYGAEDTDLAFRAAALGIPVLFSGDGHAFHQRHAAHEPPLQHFNDIMHNARRFRARHGFWPMRGWIDAFAELGLIEATGDGDYRLLREPTASEIRASTIPDHRPF